MMRRHSTIQEKNTGIPLVLDEDKKTTDMERSRSSSTWANAEKGMLSDDSADEIMLNDDTQMPSSEGGGKMRKGIIAVTFIIAFLFFFLQETETRTEKNINDQFPQRKLKPLDILDRTLDFGFATSTITLNLYYMSIQTDGMGGGTSCHNGDCLWHDARCMNFRGQCAMYPENVDSDCGMWEECGGVICSADYMVNGYEVCLARRKIDMSTKSKGKFAIVKSEMVNLLRNQDFGDMSLLPGEIGGGSRCVNGKCLWNESICQDFGGQCAIPISDIKTKCGNWDDCKGVVCRKDYVLNGVPVCLARGRIDPNAVTPGMMAIAKPTLYTMDRTGHTVCPSDRFEPNKDTYYRIKSFNAYSDGFDFFWTHERKGQEAKIVLANDDSNGQTKNDPKTHWRFVEQGSSNGNKVWHMVNRATGSKIKVSMDDTTLAMLPLYPKPISSTIRNKHETIMEFTGFCSNNRVRFNMFGKGLDPTSKFKSSGKFGVGDHDTFWVRPSSFPYLLDVKTTLQTTRIGSPERHEYWTSCDWPSADSCKSGYHEYEKSNCGFLNGGERNKCVRYAVPKDQFVKWDWIVEPASEYKRPDHKDGAVLKVYSGPEEAMGSGLAPSLAGNAVWLAAGVIATIGSASLGLGLASAMGAPIFCFVLDALIFNDDEDESFDEKLADFGDQILEITENMVWEEVGKESLHGVLSDVKTVRNKYIMQYMGEKKTDVKDAQNLDEYSLGKVDNLSNDLQKYANEYLKHFNRLFPLSKQDEDEIDVVRTRYAWDSMKVIALEMLTAWEERVALEAYMSYAEKIQSLPNPLTCEQIIDDNIQIQRVLVDQIRYQFENAHSLLLKKGKQMTVDGYDQKKIDTATGDYFPFEYIDEVEWDMVHFSYNYDEVKAALDVFKERVEKVCDLIIDVNGDDEPRERWRLFDPRNMKAAFDNIH